MEGFLIVSPQSMFTQSNQVLSFSDLFILEIHSNFLAYEKCMQNHDINSSSLSEGRQGVGEINTALGRETRLA